MRFLTTLLGALSLLNGSQTDAAIVFHTLPEPLRILNDVSLGTEEYAFDLDDNTTVDFTFGADIVVVSLKTERINRVIFTPSRPPNLGGPVSSLPENFEVGFPLFNTPLEWRSGDLRDGFVDEVQTGGYVNIVTVLSTGSSSEFNERSFIGVEFEGDEGTHYGYFEVSAANRSRPGIFLYGWAYETEAGKPITTAFIPEPSSLLLIALTCPVMLRRRRSVSGK